MIEQATASCSIGHTILLSLITGELGSLGFFVNMILISGIIYLWKTHRSKLNFDRAKQAAEDLLRNTA